jgi:cell wall-associated NlpC family hydrolase
MLAGFLLGRQVVTGRVKETPQDIRDITLAVLSGDFTSLQSTLAQRGKNVSPDVSSTVAAGASGGSDSLSDLLTNPLSSDLLAKTVELGNAAKGYVLGATGPTYYDCSGLVWRAMKTLDLYTGPRFTTSTFVAQMGGRIQKVNAPQVGDIVLWPRHHMGVVSGPDQMYSARSPQSGIGYSPINASDVSIGGTHVFYRLGVLNANSPVGSINAMIGADNG